MVERNLIRNFVCLEVLRAYMAWWVVVDHGLHLLGAGGSISGNEVPLLTHIPTVVLWFLTKGPTAVHVFMIISGFVIAHLRYLKREPYGEYIVRRAFRLLPIYFFCLFIAIAVLHLHRIACIENPFSEFNVLEASRAVSEDKGFWAHLAMHLTLLHGAIPIEMLPDIQATLLTPAWSLSLEWQFYLIAPLIVALLSTSDWRIRTGVVLLAATVEIILRHQDIAHWEFGAFLPQVAGYFFIGILSRQALDLLAGEGWQGHRRNLLWTLAATIVLGCFLDKAAIAIWAIWFFFLLKEARIVSSDRQALHAIAKVVAENRLVALAGRWSYSTYLFHFTAYSVAVGGYGALVGPSRMNPIVLTMLVILCWPTTLLCSAILYRLIEQPGVRLGRKLTRGRAGGLKPAL